MRKTLHCVFKWTIIALSSHFREQNKQRLSPSGNIDISALRQCNFESLRFAFRRGLASAELESVQSEISRFLNFTVSNLIARGKFIRQIIRSDVQRPFPRQSSSDEGRIRDRNVRRHACYSTRPASGSVHCWDFLRGIKSRNNTVSAVFLQNIS